MQGQSRGADEPRDATQANQPIADGDEGAVESGEAQAGASPSQPPPSSIEQLQAEVAKLKDAWLRTAADFDNFRKRSRRELEEARRGGKEDLLRSLLPVFDNLGRAIQSAQRSTDIKAMVEGLAMVERQFVEALGREAITKVPTVGHPFDPTVHEAIQQVETDEHAPGTVIAEVQPGYAAGDRLMRAAMVVVARAKSGDGAPGGSANEPN
jgi:molecular chaperone GrpE